MKARWFLLAAVALAAAGCPARKIQVTNPHTQYDNVWDVATQEVAKYFDVKEVDRKAGRLYTFKKEVNEGGRRVWKWCRVDIKERIGVTNRYQVRVDVFRETQRPQELEFNPADVRTATTKDADLEQAIRSRIDEYLASLP
jgi:hypothetical protein